MPIKTLSIFLLLAPNLLIGCSKDALDDSGVNPDEDGDGFFANEDCDDTNPAINLGADELCDDGDVDEDCDGLVNDDDDNFLEGTQQS